MRAAGRAVALPAGHRHLGPGAAFRAGAVGVVPAQHRLGRRHQFRRARGHPGHRAAQLGEDVVVGQRGVVLLRGVEEGAERVGLFLWLPGGDVEGEARAVVVDAEENGRARVGEHGMIRRQPAGQVQRLAGKQRLAAPDRQGAGVVVGQLRRDGAGVAAQLGRAIERRAPECHLFRDPHPGPPLSDGPCFARGGGGRNSPAARRRAAPDAPLAQPSLWCHTPGL